MDVGRGRANAARRASPHDITAALMISRLALSLNHNLCEMTPLVARAWRSRASRVRVGNWMILGDFAGADDAKRGLDDGRDLRHHRASTYASANHNGQRWPLVLVSFIGLRLNYFSLARNILLDLAPLLQQTRRAILRHDLSHHSNGPVMTKKSRLGARGVRKVSTGCLTCK
jgi:hypothetical protein